MPTTCSRPAGAIAGGVSRCERASPRGAGRRTTSYPEHAAEGVAASADSGGARSLRPVPRVALARAPGAVIDPRRSPRTGHRAEAATTGSESAGASTAAVRPGGCTPPELPSSPRRRAGHADALRGLLQPLHRGTAARDRPSQRRRAARGSERVSGGGSVVAATVSDFKSLPIVCHRRGGSHPRSPSGKPRDSARVLAHGGCVWCVADRPLRRRSRTVKRIPGRAPPLRASPNRTGAARSHFWTFRNPDVFDVERSRPFSTLPKLAGATAADRGRARRSRRQRRERAPARPRGSTRGSGSRA